MSRAHSLKAFRTYQRQRSRVRYALARLLDHREFKNNTSMTLKSS